MKNYGNKAGYKIFEITLRYLGLDFAYGLLLFIVPYYIFFRPSVYKNSKPYLMRRFPGDSFIQRYLRLFKYIFTFGQSLIDQYYFGFSGEPAIKLDFDREQEMLDLLEKKPVIFVMSHLGYWEVAMAGSSRFKKKMNVMVNMEVDKNKRKSFYDIRKNGGELKFIDIAGDYGGMIEAANALMLGEVVGVTGDRAAGWRTKTASFLGDPARFPVIAELLALPTGAAVVVLLTSKASRYHIRFHWKDISAGVISDKTLSRDEKIEKMLELYTGELENHVRDNPYLWFNFFDFWEL
ncbi:MAG: hypothetical protein ABSG94_01430 [Brevinematales bacterium]|jgi:predicted LPLAT superfamily acyltransferase